MSQFSLLNKEVDFRAKSFWQHQRLPGGSQSTSSSSQCSPHEPCSTEQRLFRSSYYPLQEQPQSHNFHPYYLEKSRTCQKLLKGSSFTSHSKTIFNNLWSLCTLQQAHLLVKSKADYWCSMPTPMLPKGSLESATTTNISSNSSFLLKSFLDGAGERSEQDLLKASCNNCDTGCLGWLKNSTRKD